MDWDKWAEDMFESCLRAIKVTNATESPIEWKFLWEMLFNYKEYRESKDKKPKNQLKD